MDSWNEGELQEELDRQLLRQRAEKLGQLAKHTFFPAFKTLVIGSLAGLMLFLFSGAAVLSFIAWVTGFAAGAGVLGLIVTYILNSDTEI